MTAGIRRSEGPAITDAEEPRLDYYLILPETGAPSLRPGWITVEAGVPSAPTEGIMVQADAVAVPAEGIVVEEFTLAGDHTAIGLDSAGWTATDGWWSSAAFSRGMRTDARLRARLVAVRRDDAEVVYRRLGGGELPGEAALRGHFHDHQPLGGSAPLRLGPERVPDGFRDRRVYRVLFANDLREDGPPRLRSAWRMALADPPARVAGTAHRRVAGDDFTWDLRRIGPGVAWCLDLTACLASASDDAVRPLLRELVTVLRHAGLIPVTIERFA
ncbi:hypothetical protein [Nonomuraea cavernae]|uniref:Uncharacterized protein n=1 Tax=Nonomuraea cavernae TaxID=2045107 RepID=A0A917ZAX7_9ACTN|nr:hypothetical protein [Nonomuraea cavernae]MCA2189788.1 hypothetical protein [Nonomuraea cavernae]GGO79851.1 hypothetical protein GCM10012289_65130 [Nonomuraea cavernae]